MDVIIAARNHAVTLSRTLATLPHRTIRSVVVVDNASTDATAQVGRDAGAIVLREPRVGYGSACLRAVAHLGALPKPPDAVVFMAPDGSDDPRDLPALIEPMRTDNAELVIGVRQGTRRHAPEQRIVLGLIGAIYRHRFEDLSPFRAIRFPALIALALRDPTEAFHIEMQVKAIKLGLHIAEVPIGASTLRERAHAGSAAVTSAGRALFHILRHATSR